MPDIDHVPENVRAAFADRAFLQVPALAALLGIDVKTLKKHVEIGDLPGRVKGSGSVRQHWVFTIHDVAEFLQPRAPVDMRLAELTPKTVTISSGKAAPRSGKPRLRKRHRSEARD